MRLQSRSEDASAVDAADAPAISSEDAGTVRRCRYSVKRGSEEKQREAEEEEGQRPRSKSRSGLTRMTTPDRSLDVHSIVATLDNDFQGEYTTISSGAD